VLTSADLPRYPELVIGERVYVGSTLHNFDSEGVFDYGIFAFVISAKDIDEVIAMLDEASIEVSHALRKVTASDSLISSNVRSISITAR